MLRVGVVGCGNIGKIHAMALQKRKDVRICGFADVRMERAQAYAGAYTGGAAGSYGSLEELLGKEQPDVIHICTPHDCHVPMAVKTLAFGAHVFMEKPPAISREEFALLEGAQAGSRGRVGVCFQNRYNETTQRVSALLQQGRLGTLRGGRAFVTWNRTAPYYTESGWRGTKAREGGGVLINQAVHTLDLLLQWMGTPVLVEASACNHHLPGVIEVEDTLEAWMTFESGEDPVRACLYATNAYVSDAPVLIELTGTGGTVRVEGDAVYFRTRPEETWTVWQSQGGTVPGKDYWGRGHEACIADFYESLEGDRPYQNDLDSVKNTFETMMRIYEAAGCRPGKGESEWKK